MLLQWKPAWAICTGPVKDEDVNHGLGGTLTLGPAKENGQPKNVLCWGGASNVVWWICKDEGVAGFFATQMTPFADKKVLELTTAWRREFWAGRKAR